MGFRTEGVRKDGGVGERSWEWKGRWKGKWREGLGSLESKTNVKFLDQLG